MGTPFSLAGYYAILDVRPEERSGAARPEARSDEARPMPDLVAQASALLAAAPACLQLRAKGATARELAAWSRALLPLARKAGVPFCVNDRLDVALAVGADAVHLGQDDLPLAAAKAVAAGRLRIGVSTHDEEQVRAAVAQGADYLGFGPVFPTLSKANPDPLVGLIGLARAVALSSVPVVAIGGIDLDNVADVAATGVACAAVISAVNRASDPTSAGRQVAAAFRR